MRSSVPVPGPENRDKRGPPRGPLARLHEDGSPLDGQASGAKLDRRERVPPREEVGTKETRQKTASLDRRIIDPEAARWNRRADGSGSAVLRPGAAPI